MTLWNYDGTEHDAYAFVEYHYESEGVWDLAESLYDARQLARGLAGILIADEYYSPVDLVAHLGLAALPNWLLDED